MKVLKSLTVALGSVVALLPTSLLANWSNYPFFPAPWVHGGNWRGPDFIWDVVVQILPYV